ncbi:hypothetical protein Pmani_039960 [Petrolisthes manimaculis]|uniref:Uncharacterized protein n=1 Tax=Petrolisthes manimaculis TaxID=1843537 RepID=A0AAE1ND87_9EUCA|nr:hypothetical protein Pmani_039960 [Petrolisthes manimaculis]
MSPNLSICPPPPTAIPHHLHASSPSPPPTRFISSPITHPRAPGSATVVLAPPRGFTDLPQLSKMLFLSIVALVDAALTLSL